MDQADGKRKVRHYREQPRDVHTDCDLSLIKALLSSMNKHNKVALLVSAESLKRERFRRKETITSSRHWVSNNWIYCSRLLLLLITSQKMK